MRQSRGSAMLIAMLVVSLVGVVGFGLVRITIRQLRQQGSVAASTRAYQAAEAGLEYALLQYKLDKNASLGTGAGGGAPDARGFYWRPPLSLTLSADQAILVRSTSQYQRIGPVACLSNPYTTAAAFKACDGAGGRTLVRLSPGATLKITPQGSDPRYIFFKGLVDGAVDTDAAIVITAYQTDGAVIGTQNVYRPGSATASTERISPSNAGYSAASDYSASAAYFTVRYLNEAAGAAPFYGALLVSKHATSPEGANIIPFKTDRLMISVEGQSGGVARRLEAVVNTGSNSFEGIYDYSQTALGVVDYVLSGQEIVTP